MILILTESVMTLLSGTTTIGQSAFSYCYALAEIFNYSSLNLAIGSSANGYISYYAKVVYNASDLTGGKPETRIQTINNMQYYCYGNDFIALAPTSRNITEVNLDESTTEINEYAFSDCKSLTQVTIPSNVTRIGSFAFKDCKDLTDVIFEDTTSKWTVKAGSSIKYDNVDVSNSATNAVDFRGQYRNYSSTKK